MPVIQLANGLLQTISVNAQTSSDTSFTPSASTGFPASPQFTLLNIRTAELLLVTALGSTWTIVRGYGGSTAQAINAGDALQYSVTREMLLSGFMAKLDEVVLAANSAAVQTLTVPSGLAFMRNLKLRIMGSGTANDFLNWRFNNDSSANYDNNFAYWGTSSSSGQWNGMTYGRVWFGEIALPGIGGDVEIEIGGADATDRNKTWVAREWYWSGATKYHMIFSGIWHPVVQSAISTIQLAVDGAQNGTWNGGSLQAGFRATLYGVP